MRERSASGIVDHSGVCMVVGVDRRKVDADAANFDNYPQLRTFNPHLVVASRIVDHLLEFGKTVLTARSNGGQIEVYTNGKLIDIEGNPVSERSLGLTIKSFHLRGIRDTEQADVVAKKVVRGGKALVFEMVA